MLFILKKNTRLAFLVAASLAFAGIPQKSESATDIDYILVAAVAVVAATIAINTLAPHSQAETQTTPKSVFQSDTEHAETAHNIGSATTVIVDRPDATILNNQVSYTKPSGTVAAVTAVEAVTVKPKTTVTVK